MSYAGIERRRWPRIPAAALGNMSASILAGPEAVKLVDLSCGGALLEVAARFPLKSSVRLKLTQPGGEPILVEGRVARAKVAALVNGVINYRFAVIFDKPIGAFPGSAGDQLAASAVAAGAPSDAGKDASVATPQAAPVAGERTLAIVPARPVAVASVGESDESPVVLRGDLERERNRLEKELAAATAELARQSTANQSLAEQLEKSDELRTALRGELEKERSRLAQELGAATADLARQSMVNQSLEANLAKSDELLIGLRDELATERSRLEQQLAATTEDLARQSAANQFLSANLEKSDELLSALHDELQAERCQWEEDRSTLLQQVADAVTVADALQAARETREQEQAQALAEQRDTLAELRDKYEALIAELLTSTNDQQTEYQQLVEDLTAAGDEQRRRAEHHEAEVARERAAAQQDRADAEARRQELEARLEAAETLCAAHEARNQALRRQLEILVSLSTAPLTSTVSEPHEPAAADATEVERKRAIA